MNKVLSEEFCGGAIKWEKPQSGWTKINVDAACFNDFPFTGGAAVERDDQGHWVAAMTNTKAEKLAPVVAEAWALKEALSWIKTRSSSLISPVMFAVIVWIYLSVKVSFVYRSANMVAHALARETYSMSGRRSWFDSVPEFLRSVFISDSY
ncbi:uncharacterized protein LOC126668577 [Mercurialis annua]|uniref:uncharacterized protein LOC126668577 n=1 Tax=Mercurialis annua TaxID=3986 RepID=UPI00215EE0D0|nr:uncharacterized protein LOC126668577 [Mercurialis annua]